MALTDETQPLPPKGPSMVIQIVILLVMTLAAIGLGWGAGMYLKSGVEPAPAATEAAATEEKEAPADAHGKPEAGDKAEGHGAAVGGSLMTDLAPITTNLAAPAQIWVRMEATIVVDEPQPPALAEMIHQDLLAYLRTLKLHQIEGPSGYQHLKADLEERARIRSDGHVTQVLVRTLLFE